MLKEKDLRASKKKLKGLKGYDSHQKLLGQASRSALLLTTLGGQFQTWAPNFHAWRGSSGPPVVIPDYFKIVQF
jgi:hypothetical protein